MDTEDIGGTRIISQVVIPVGAHNGGVSVHSHEVSEMIARLGIARGQIER